MISLLQSVGGFLFIFGIVVFVHELGHFLAAKLVGVYTPRFSVGFGPGPRKRIGETEYILGLIPLGGYVRMASRDDEAMAFIEGGGETPQELKEDAVEQRKTKDWDPEAIVPFGPKPVPSHRWFESKTLPQKLFVMLAGVTMNALLTIVVLVGMAAYYGQSTIRTTVIGDVADVPAASELRQHLSAGDTIFAVQGRTVESWNDVHFRIIDSDGDTLRLATSRGPVAIAAGPALTPSRMALAGALEPYVAPVIGLITPNRPAAAAGIQVGDSIVSIGGAPTVTFSDLIAQVTPAAGRPIDFELVREGQRLTVTVTPEATPFTDPETGESSMVGRIGAGNRPPPITHEELAFGQAVRVGFDGTIEAAGLILRTLKGLVRRDIPMDQLGGPIMIAQESARAAQAGFPALLGLLALLSINLAILNLLPIPVLDGGQILIVLAEAVKGGPFSPRARQYIMGSGIAMVLLLLLVVSYNDVLRALGG
jgi:regulator of sigma E protease